MTFAIHVKGGTGAGSKRQPKERRWIHVCADLPEAGGLVLSSYSCPHCGTRRPSARPFPTNSTPPVLIER